MTIKGLRAHRIPTALVAQPGSPIHKTALEEGIPVCPIRMRGPFDLVSAWRLASLARLKGVEILHLQTSHAAGQAQIARFFRCRAKMVISRRVDFPIKNLKKYRGAQAVVAISTAIKDILVDAGVPPAKVRVIPSGIPTNIEKPAGVSSLRQEIAGDAEFLVGVVGHLAEHKGHRYLIEALPRALEKEPNLKLAIIGDGELRTELEATAARLGVAANIIFTGFREDALDLIWILDLLAVPSITEGLCTTIFDSMLRKVPIVATAVGGIPEALEGGRYGMLVPPGDPPALADAIVAGLHDEAARKAMTEGAELRVKENFCADVMVEKTIELYRELL